MWAMVWRMLVWVWVPIWVQQLGLQCLAQGYRIVYKVDPEGAAVKHRLLRFTLLASGQMPSLTVRNMASFPELVLFPNLPFVAPTLFLLLFSSSASWPPASWAWAGVIWVLYASNLLRVVARVYWKSGGGGINIQSKSVRLIGLDWHRFPLRAKGGVKKEMVNWPHIDIPPLYIRYWPWDIGVVRETSSANEARVAANRKRKAEKAQASRTAAVEKIDALLAQYQLSDDIYHSLLPWLERVVEQDPTAFADAVSIASPTSDIDYDLLLSKPVAKMMSLIMRQSRGAISHPPFLIKLSLVHHIHHHRKSQ